jgi:serine/threonine protein kinase
VVCSLALIPVALSAVLTWSDETVAAGARFGFVFHVAWWMVFGAILAIYGCHKMQVLQQEAFAARRLGPYRLKGRLGTGGMGEVYLAEHVLLRRPCAVKLIRPERASNPKELRRFEREVQATAALTHPNTVQVYDYGHTADGTFYYAMEYLAGLNLDELVHRDGPLPPERAIRLLRQICGALAQAHAAGLIHRDIKPGNIIVVPDDVAKLLDFGLVHAVGKGVSNTRLTQDGDIAGTPAFMSPEQAAGQEELDARSDIYSLGAVAYFLMTGQPPFTGSAVRVLAAHLYEAPVPLTSGSDLPAGLHEIVLRCLAKNPAGRFADVHSLEAALAGCHGPQDQ